jgi:hypothetical protein
MTESATECSMKESTTPVVEFAPQKSGDFRLRNSLILWRVNGYCIVLQFYPTESCTQAAIEEETSGASKTDHLCYTLDYRINHSPGELSVFAALLKI